MPNSVITDEQANTYREQLAAYDRQKAYEAALVRHQAYLAIKPVLDGPAYAELQQQISQVRQSVPATDGYFSIGLEAIFQGMTSLSTLVAGWSAPAPPDAQPPAESAGA